MHFAADLLASHGNKFSHVNSVVTFLALCHLLDSTINKEYKQISSAWRIYIDSYQKYFFILLIDFKRKMI